MSNRQSPFLLPFPSPKEFRLTGPTEGPPTPPSTTIIVVVRNTVGHRRSRQISESSLPREKPRASDIPPTGVRPGSDRDSISGFSGLGTSPRLQLLSAATPTQRDKADRAPPPAQQHRNLAGFYIRTHQLACRERITQQRFLVPCPGFHTLGIRKITIQTNSNHNL